MGLNITHTSNFQFENREHLKNTARDILAKQGASKEVSNKIIDQVIFNKKSNEVNYEQHLAILKASTQISLNNSLKETLNYLKKRTTKKVSQNAKFGELWEILGESKETNYDGDLVDFVVDKNLKNIFAA